MSVAVNAAPNECEPALRDEVANCAWPPVTVTGDPSGEPPSVNCTVPIGDSADDTVAVSVTVAPGTAVASGETDRLVAVDLTTIEYDSAGVEVDVA